MAEHGLYVGDPVNEADILADLRQVLEEALRQLQDAELELRRTHDRYRLCLDGVHAARKRVDDQVVRMHRQMLHR